MIQLQPFALDIHLQKIIPSALDIELVVAFQRDGVLDCMPAWPQRENEFRIRRECRSGRDLMPLSAGEYNVTVMVARAGYYR
ncbi:MAG: hypothetical protein R3D52_06840 [Xanthobacteraceae bacterium]